MVLISPAALFCAQKVVNLDLPSWITAEEAKYLSGGTSDVNVKAAATLDGFKSGKFQAALETEIGNFIPAKAAALLGNAALQRTAIATSNTLFGWECYPTFYNSDFVYIPNEDMLMQLPYMNKQSTVEGLNCFAESLSKFATAHPDKEFCVVVADHSKSSHLNPVINLTSKDWLATDDVVRILQKAVKENPSIHIILKTYSTLGEYKKYYYTTDHHWNGYGALDAYSLISSEMGLDPATTHSCELVFDGIVYNGSTSRKGLMLLDPAVEEPNFDFGDLSVESGVWGYALLNDGIEAVKKNRLATEFSFYQRWYGTERYNCISNLAGRENALIVSDSHGNPLRWLIAKNYQFTFDYMDLHNMSKGNHTLIDRIEAANTDVVYFVGFSTNFATFTSRFPNYFG